MDINAAYQGRTVLDWVIETDRQSPLTRNSRTLGAQRGTGDQQRFKNRVEGGAAIYRLDLTIA
jgi:hypothetical protein